MSSPVAIRPGPYRYNAALGRYIGPDGRMVPRGLVDAGLEAVITAQQTQVRRLCADLRTGRSTLAQWQLGMATAIRLAHTTAAGVGAGGIGALTAQEWGRVGLMTRDQYRYLARFALAIEGGLPLDAAFVRRALLYPLAARRTASQQARIGAAQAGMQAERNVLGAADHCPGCLDATRAGWAPLGSLPAIGTRECHNHCRCHFDYRAEVAE